MTPHIFERTQPDGYTSLSAYHIVSQDGKEFRRVIVWVAGYPCGIRPACPAYAALLHTARFFVAGYPCGIRPAMPCDRTALLRFVVPAQFRHFF